MRLTARSFPILVFFGLMVASSLRGEEKSKSPPPRDLGIVERTEANLILLDVTVTGKDGKPVRGLRASDFELRIDGRAQAISAVDAFCNLVSGPSQEAELAAPSTETPETPGLESPLTTIRETSASFPRAEEPRWFVLYFDFHEMTFSGRRRAIEAAHRWVEKVKKPEEQASVIAFGPMRVKTLADFTADPARLLQAIDAAYADAELVDPYPNQREFRRCCDFPPPWPPGCACGKWAEEEYEHMIPSFNVLPNLLRSLQFVPGLKTFILFHETTALNPYLVYNIQNLTPIDQLDRLEEIGAAATAARAQIHTAYVGSSTVMVGYRDALNFGQNGADLTGGSFNRLPEELDTFVAGAGREETCYYRVAFKPPAGRSRRLHWAKVYAPGEVAPSLIRLRYQNDTERWRQRAEAAMTYPDLIPGIPVGAALIPLSASQKDWTVAIEVAFPADSVGPEKEGKNSRVWGAGAVLVRDGGADLWPYESFPRAILTEEKAAGRVILHRRIAHLKPGRYDLNAYAGEAGIGDPGGALAHLTLPASGNDATTGPVFMRARRETIELPLISFRDAKKIPPTAPVKTASVPLDSGGLAPGELAMAVTLVCPASEDLPPVDVQRYVSKEGTPLLRLEDTEPERAGRCWRITDEFAIPPGPSAPGTYSYHLRWRTDGTSIFQETSVSFSVVATAEATTPSIPALHPLQLPDLPPPPPEHPTMVPAG